MFTIMDNRKRPRLELVNTPTQPSNDCMQGVNASTNSLGSATLATIGGQSFILSNTGSTSLPANILLSICDENSDESEEYIIDSSVLQQIKQENSVATQTTPSSNSQPTTAQLLTTIPQYRIINQTGKTLNNASLTSTPSSSTIVSSPVTTNTTLIPTSMQLSSGCEIYVIKEVIEPPKQLLAEPTTPQKTILNNNNATTTTIKLEPMSPTPTPAAGTIQLMRSSTATSSNKPQNQQQQQPQHQQQQQQQNIISNICQNSTLSVNPSNTCSQDDSNRRSLILEAYKKRDDKRRATHNEVERRRRDKINSWIFKLKEMLPSDTHINGGNTQQLLVKDAVSLNTNVNGTSMSTRLLVQQGSSTRTPPSDSKSQILIKACEYIKTMQEEIQSLRECLTENDNLRLSNQRLQEELNSLRNKQQQQRQHLTISNNNSINSNSHNNTNTILLTSSQSDDECELTLNSLNATYANVQLFSPSATSNNHLPAVIGPVTTATTSNTGITYAKRELIIRDYVD